MEISYVNVFVSELEAAIGFYRDKLGLELEHSDPEHGYASFSAGAVRLGLAVAGEEQRDLIGRHTGVGFAIADLEEEHARLVELEVGFDMPPTRQPWGGFMAMVSDPDGNIFYLDQVSETH